MLLAPVATLRSASSATAQEAQEPEEVEEVEELEEPPTSLSQEEQDALKKEDHACQIMSAPKLSCCRLVLPRRHSGTWLRPHYVNEMYDKTQQINKPMPRFRTKCKSLTTYWRSKLLTLGSDLEFSLWADARVPPQHGCYPENRCYPRIPCEAACPDLVILGEQSWKGPLREAHDASQRRGPASPAGFDHLVTRARVRTSASSQA